MNTTQKLTELLTKKDFEKIASAIADCKMVIDFRRQDRSLGSAQLDQAFTGMVDDIAKVLELTNPKFNVAKFRVSAFGRKAV